MRMTKIAMACAVSWGMTMAGSAANAEPVRAAGTMPGVVTAKAIKLARTAAPAAREARAVETGPALLIAAAGGIAGVALGKAIDDNDSPGG